MLIQMWEFIKFLGMVIIVLVLIAIIYALFDVIYNNIKVSILKRKLTKELNKSIKLGDIKIEKITDISKDDK